MMPEQLILDTEGRVASRLSRRPVIGAIMHSVALTRRAIAREF
jgi:hypothetical protein